MKRLVKIVAASVSMLIVVILSKKTNIELRNDREEVLLKPGINLKNLVNLFLPNS